VMKHSGGEISDTDLVLNHKRYPISFADILILHPILPRKIGPTHELSSRWRTLLPMGRPAALVAWTCAVALASCAFRASVTRRYGWQIESRAQLLPDVEN